MFYAAYGLAALLAAAIVFLGAQYVFTPWATTRSFGLPRPADDAVTAPWLRLKGVRDIASGLAVFALMLWGGPRLVGIVFIVLAIIPLGDMSVILAANGSTKSALGIHGVTALLMLLAGIPLALGAV
jgi:hypothetical protein